MKKTGAILFLVCSFLIEASAQINESDSSKFQFQESFRGSFQAGSVELLRLTNQLDFSLRIGDGWVLKTQNNWLYQEIFGFKADNDVLSRNYLYFQPDKKWYAYSLFYASSNFRRKLNNRFFGGLGVTWQLLQMPGHNIKLSGNFIYEESRFSSNRFNLSEYNGSFRQALWRNTIYLSGYHSWKSGAVKGTYELYWQPAWDNPHNYRYAGSMGLDFRLIPQLFLTTRWNLTFENLVVEKVANRDFIWTWGLSFQAKSKERT